MAVEEFATSLQHLQTEESSLSDVCTQDVSALTKLVVTGCCLFGNNGHMYWDVEMSLVPTNITGLLTRLQTLHLSTGLGGEANVVKADLRWIASLTSLQDLSIAFGHSRGDVVQHAALLTNLTRLAIFGFCEHVDEAPVVNVDIDWHRLHALQELSICSVRIQLGNEFAGLLRLCHLTSVHLRTVHLMIRRTLNLSFLLL